jgi:hypothetical protein
MHKNNIMGWAIIVGVFFCPVAAVASDAAGSTNVRGAKHAIEFNWKARFSQILAEDPAVRGEMCGDLAADMPASEVPEAIDFLNLATDHDAKVLEIDLAERWGEVHPRIVADWAHAHLPDDAYCQDLYFHIVTFWAQEDFDAARSYVDRMPPGGCKTAASFSLTTQAANENRGKLALTLTNGLPPGAPRDNLVSYCVRKWARTDPGGAVAWTLALHDKVKCQRIINAIVCDISVTDPRRGLKIAIEDMSAGGDQDAAIDLSIRFWAAADPKSAADWAQALTSPHLRNVAIAALPSSKKDLQ